MTNPIFGAHIQTFNEDTIAWVEAAQCRVVKIVATQDGIPILVRWCQEGWLKDIILRSDDHDYPLVLNEEVISDDDSIAAAALFNISEQATVTATRNLNFAVPFIAAGLGKRLRLEGVNEMPVWNQAQMVAYSFHESRRAEIIADAGLRALTFQFPVGHPDLGLWQYAVPYLRIIKSKGGGLALHQYSQPDLMSTGDLTTWRHAKIYEQLPADLQDLPLFITEFGIDGGVSFRVRTGWRGYCDEPLYLDQIRSAAPYLTKPRGITFFTFADSSQGWPTFEMAGTIAIAQQIRQWNEENAQEQEQEQEQEGGVIVMSTAHELYDRWARSLTISGVGYNPNTALGKYWQSHPEIGVPIGDEWTDNLEGEPIVCRNHVMGIVLARKSDWKMAFVRTEEQLESPFLWFQEQ